MFNDKAEIEKISTMLAFYYPFTLVEIERAITKYKSVDIVLKAMEKSYKDETALDDECQQLANR